MKVRAKESSSRVMQRPTSSSLQKGTLGDGNSVGWSGHRVRCRDLFVPLGGAKSSVFFLLKGQIGGTCSRECWRNFLLV